MALGDVLQRHAGQAVVATSIISEAVMMQLPGPAAQITVGRGNSRHIVRTRRPIRIRHDGSTQWCGRTGCKG
ncbi:hypothetical protein [Streptomyces sp. NPDC092129]|uniref:hypothetical protein n=1 Tax=Streptomyces sp. NPDC092129 TaxID=3366010 RepID=UPI0038087563